MTQTIKTIGRRGVVLVYRIIRFFSVILATKFIHCVFLGQKLNHKNPKIINDKIQCLNLYYKYKNKLIVECADKYKVRDYLKKCGYENILNELYGVYDKASDINWDSLPNKFVLKCNHGAGFNIICEDKNNLNKKATIRKLNKWMKIDYSKRFNEKHYKNIPRKIISEKYLGNEKGRLPKHYNIFCFNGQLKIILLCKDRESNLKCGFYDLDWNVLPYLAQKHDASDELNVASNKPECLGEMLECAKKLSAPFPYVRVDFYVVENKLIFGEITFTTSACLYKYNQKGRVDIGKMIDIENLIKNNQLDK